VRFIRSGGTVDVDIELGYVDVRATGRETADAGIGRYESRETANAGVRPLRIEGDGRLGDRPRRIEPACL
jgi:hypothetical protein